jgi:hypothetical protein
LNLTLVPSITGLKIIPAEIKFSLGEIKTKFRISVPETTNDGEYYIVWETKNDNEP